MRLYLGIDWGFTGALALIAGATRTIVDVWDMPVTVSTKGRRNYDLEGLVQVFGEIRARTEASGSIPLKYALEKVTCSPVQRTSDVLRTGVGYGMILALLRTQYVSWQGVEVPAQRWKQYYRLSQDKETSRHLAISHFSEQAWHFSRKKDHNRAEAALLADYAYVLDERGGSEVLEELKPIPRAKRQDRLFIEGVPI